MSQKQVQEIFSEALRQHNERRVAEAERLYKKVLALDPLHAHSLHMLGRIAADALNYAEAENLVGRALALQKDVAVFHRTMGGIFRAQRKYEEAMDSYALSISLKPSANASLSLGELLQGRGRYEEAIKEYRAAIALKPDNMTAISNIAAIFTNLRMFDKAEAYCRHVLAREPEHPHALNNLAVAYKASGRMEEAMACARRAVAAAPHNAPIYSNLLLMMVYAASVSPEELAEESRAFGRSVADIAVWRNHESVARQPEKKLRVGFVSPDFFSHAVNYFFEPLLNRRDRENFEFFGYSCVAKEDHVTARLKPEFDQWRDIRFMGDDDAADLIQADKIDILIDLAGHTADNRLMMFAQKPAPVQVTWLGYPATTGMKAMDYRITDFYAEPPGKTESLNVERLWRLPDIFCCYQPHENSPAVVDRAPCEDNGHITFGCFNNFAKVTDDTLAAWTRIMAAVPGSRLLLEIGSLDEFRATVEGRLAQSGLPMDRVILEPRSRENQFVLYNRIDIALDPFPCCGGTTSMDTLWMGVPFVTLAGAHFVSRMGVTILINAGMPEFIAQDVDEYVVKAAALATDRAALNECRRDLRARAAASPLMDQDAFARHMQAALREMWREWCR